MKWLEFIINANNFIVFSIGALYVLCALKFKLDPSAIILIVIHEITFMMRFSNWLYIVI